ncbi:hypothetical protein niasHS_002595 [Heterodera schachtii]|uniref:Tudor domain-containing protein n=1 Tax=Heterodera schachtii TaxID=97005 RepID=A0ABD2KKF3_HETSC
MAFCTRPISPILTESKNRQKELILDRDKIHRIALNTPAICVLSHVASANCIWFKLFNHITGQLQLGREQLKKLDRTKTVENYQYVMAPLNENVYARGRVLCRCDSNWQIVYVHFIDEGYGAWMYEDCLAQMDRFFFSHPWQAFPIALFKTSKMAEPSREELVRILKQFPRFNVIPAMGNQRIASANNYYDHVRADVFGLKSSEGQTNERNDRSESIAHLLMLVSLASEEPTIRRAMFEARQLRLMRQKLGQPKNDELSSIPEWRKSFPPESLKDEGTIETKVTQAKSDEETPDEIHVQVPPITKKWLVENCFNEKESGMIQICIDWNSLKSPHEFYGFPLTNETNNGSSGGMRNSDPIRALFESQIALADKLDGFYGKPENRLHFEPSKIASQLRKGPVFAIIESNKRIFIGREGATFRRIQILSIRNLNSTSEFANEFCRIRYIDIGGSEIVPLSGVLRMHREHSRIVPLCMQLTLESIKPPNRASEWLPKECTFFRSLIRTDRAMSCRIRHSNQSANYQPSSYNSSPQRWAGVFGVTSLLNGNFRVEEQMVGGVENGEGNREVMAAWANLENGFH